MNHERQHPQTTSFGWSHQLKESGIVQQGLYGWYQLRTGYALCRIPPRWHKKNLYAVAFTTDELIALLGDRFGVLERFSDGTFFACSRERAGWHTATGIHIPDVLAELLCKVTTMKVNSDALR